jgi:hypothetical protein
VIDTLGESELQIFLKDSGRRYRFTQTIFREGFVRNMLALPLEHRRAYISHELRSHGMPSEKVTWLTTVCIELGRTLLEICASQHTDMDRMLALVQAIKDREEPILAEALGMTRAPAY